MEKVGKVIKARVDSLLSDARALAEDIENKSDRFRERSIKVRDQKKKMKDLELTEEDFYEDLAELSKLNYSLFLMGENYKHVVSCLYEINIQTGLLGLSFEEIGVGEEDVEEIREKVKSASPLYTSKAGKVVIADEELHKMVFNGMEQRLSDKNVLSQSFKMIE